jgi:release factor glutamine methyltransferase
MSTIMNDSLYYAVKSIEKIGGYNPLIEAEELLDKAVEGASFDELIERRIINHEPTAYITNHCKFRNLDLFIDERVLVPRSETEPLVEIAVEDLPLEASVVDVGTGSGAVALAVKNERRDLQVTGVDISKDALDVACINATALDLDVDWHYADLLDGVKGEFDCVLANLPYLPTTKKDSYEPEMTEHEPQVALWGGEDGFELIRRLLAQVQRRKGVSLLALEVGIGQEKDVCEMVRAAGFPTVFCTTDSRGQIRAVVGKR